MEWNNFYWVRWGLLFTGLTNPVKEICFFFYLGGIWTHIFSSWQWGYSSTAHCVSRVTPICNAIEMKWNYCYWVLTVVLIALVKINFKAFPARLSLDSNFARWRHRIPRLRHNLLPRVFSLPPSRRERTLGSRLGHRGPVSDFVLTTRGHRMTCKIYDLSFYQNS